MTADPVCSVNEPMAAIEVRMETNFRKEYQHDSRVSPNMVYAKFVHGETRPVDGIPIRITTFTSSQ